MDILASWHLRHLRLEIFLTFFKVLLFFRPILLSNFFSKKKKTCSIIIFFSSVTYCSFVLTKLFFGFLWKGKSLPENSFLQTKIFPFYKHQFLNNSNLMEFTKIVNILRKTWSATPNIMKNSWSKLIYALIKFQLVFSNII